MTGRAVLALACLAATAAYPKDEVLPLTATSQAQLEGESLVVTRHELPHFRMHTARSAAFGLGILGGPVWDVDQLGLPDPADIVESTLVPLIVSRYHMELKPATQRLVDSEKPAKVVRAQVDADYVLDLWTGIWAFHYYPTRWATYWVEYGVQTRLLDARTGAIVTNLACNANTYRHREPPSSEALMADGARLLQDVLASMAWLCVPLLGQQEFLLTGDAFPSSPPEYANPLHDFAARQGRYAVEVPAGSAGQPEGMGISNTP
jgi:hypothetical protein